MCRTNEVEIFGLISRTPLVAIGHRNVHCIPRTAASALNVEPDKGFNHGSDSIPGLWLSADCGKASLIPSNTFDTPKLCHLNGAGLILSFANPSQNIKQPTFY
jgi:hypothetical protein